MNPQESFLDSLKWTSDGLIPAIVQDAGHGAVLMMAWMDRSAVERTLETGQTHFYSRSRKSAWHKGATSGHVQYVEEVCLDCDADVLLIRVKQVGGACHEGYRTCFFRRVEPDGTLKVVSERIFSPDDVYKS